jgi:hypothetical protein
MEKYRRKLGGRPGGQGYPGLFLLTCRDKANMMKYRQMLSVTAMG